MALMKLLRKLVDVVDVEHTVEGLKHKEEMPKRTEEKKIKICREAGPGWVAGLAGLQAGFSGRVVCSKFRDFGRKLGSKNPRICGILAKLRLRNANKGGVGPKATDPWTKTTKNATNRQIGSNP